MYASTYDMVLENSRAMQRQLFPGAFGSPENESKDMEVFNLIDSKKKISLQEICSELSISRSAAKISIDKMIGIGRARFFEDGETVLLIEREQESIGGSSEDGEDSI